MSYMDRDMLQVKTFTAGASSMEEASKKVDARVNSYLQYDANLVHSIQPVVTFGVYEGMTWYQYTVMVTLRA